MIKRKPTAIFLSLILSAALLFSASAEQLTNAKIEELRRQIEQDEEKKKQVDAEKQEIDVKLDKIGAELDVINSELNELDLQMGSVKKQLRETTEKEELKTAAFKKRLRVIAEEGATSYLNILLSSESIFDFFYNLEILKQISRYDDKVVKDIKEMRIEIEGMQTELEGVIAVVEEKKAEQESIESSLKSEADKKSQLLQAYESQIKANEKKMEDEEKRIREQLARQAQNTSTVKYGGGKFAWPAPGYGTVTSEYGYRFHPVLKYNKLHTGMDIGVPVGATVVAAEDGVVIAATYSNAYGNYVSINHGSGIVTLYAHNSSLLVKAGQNVKRGEAISKSGNTGYSTGPHLHVEVIVGGNTVNPRSYFF